MKLDITDWPRLRTQYLAPLMVEQKETGARLILHSDGTQYAIDPKTGSWIKLKGRG